MPEKLNGPISEPQILISKRKCLLGSALATLSHSQWLRSEVPLSGGLVFREGRRNGSWPGKICYWHLLHRHILSPHSLGHFIHIAGLTQTRYFWKKYGGALCVFKIQRSTSVHTLTNLFSIPAQFSGVKFYPTNDLISNTAK